MSQTSSTERSDDDFFNGEWIREATAWEESFDICNRFGNFLIWYQLNLKSRSTLQGEHIRRALTHLYRKCPNLSVCLSVRNGATWVRRAINPNVDFEVCQGESIQQVRKRLQNHQYNMETGPLFCARLLLNASDVEEPDHDEQDLDLHYKSHLFFGFAHTFVDATSIMYIIGFFIALLNDVISDRPINEAELLGTFVNDDRTQNIVRGKKLLIQTDPILKAQLSREIARFQAETPYIVKAFEYPTVERKTSVLEKVLDYMTTIRFVEECHKRSLSAKSCFSAIVNVALVDIFIENGIIRDDYEIQCFHMINLRHFWDTKIRTPLGLHIGYPLAIYHDTPRKTDLDFNFWEYARSIHDEIQYGIDTERVLLYQGFETLSCAKLPYTEDMLLGSKNYAGDYLICNLGDVTSKVTEEGEHVRISQVLRSSTIHLSEFPVGIECHTFRGRFAMTLNYNTAAVRKDIMERLQAQIVHRIEKLL